LAFVHKAGCRYADDTKFRWVLGQAQHALKCYREDKNLSVKKMSCPCIQYENNVHFHIDIINRL
jgi:hypothetical protein